MFDKNAPLRRTLNEIVWMGVNRQARRIALANLRAYLGQALADKSHLTPITEADYLASRRSDRVFVFGSGDSLNDISPEAWAHIAEHDTFGFSMFVYQDFVRTDYHLLREMYILHEFERDFWLPYSQEFVDYLDGNPHFKETILLVQSGWRSLTVNRMLAKGMLKRPRRLLYFKIWKRDGRALPSFEFKKGITHGVGTLTDAINMAALGGWRHIILTGVDLYNGRYFWEKNLDTVTAEDFGRDPAQQHNTVRNGILDNLTLWRDALGERGITLWVYNPKSLLTEILPIYSPDDPRLHT